MEHGDGGRLIAGPGREEARKLFARLILSSGGLCSSQALRPPLRRHQRGQISELL